MGLSIEALVQEVLEMLRNELPPRHSIKTWGESLPGQRGGRNGRTESMHSQFYHERNTTAEKGGTFRQVWRNGKTTYEPLHKKTSHK